MGDYEFRNANSEEVSQYRNHLVDEKGINPHEADLMASEAHIGKLNGFQGTTPSYVGGVLIVLHQNVSFYEVFAYDEDGELIEVKQEA